MFVENAVAQQLRAAGSELFFYTWEEPAVGAAAKRPRAREADFLIVRGFSDAAGKLRVSPVEVKSGKRYSTVFLDDFAKRFGSRVGTQFVLHPKQLKVESGHIYLPLYMAHLV